MSNFRDIIDRWRDVHLGKHTRFIGTSRSSNVYPDGDHVYSYGSHFVLAQALYEGAEYKWSQRTGGRFHGFLLNGDTYSVSTSRHQREAQWSLEGRTFRSVTIPFSALSSAFINPREVRIVESLAPRYLAERRCDTKPPKSRYSDSPGPVITDQVDDRGWPMDQSDQTWRDSQVVSHVNGVYRWWSHRHVLGEAVVKARVYGRRKPDGEFARPVRYFLSGWDHQDGTYFFCALPHKVGSVEEAYDSLMPAAVRAAQEQGIPVTRQGDLFFIPAPFDTRTLTKMGAKRERMGDLYGTNHQATEVARTPDGLYFARGIAYHRPQGRRPDHMRRYLDKTGWALAVRNTVPVTPPRRVRSVSVRRALATW